MGDPRGFRLDESNCYAQSDGNPRDDCLVEIQLDVPIAHDDLLTLRRILTDILQSIACCFRHTAHDHNSHVNRNIENLLLSRLINHQEWFRLDILRRIIRSSAREIAQISRWNINNFRRIKFNCRHMHRLHLLFIASFGLRYRAMKFCTMHAYLQTRQLWLICNDT